MNQADGGTAALRETMLSNIREGHWQPGEKIPPERELGLPFGIGRTVVRRVLAELKEQGLITQGVGSGTFVAGDAATRLKNSGADTPAMHTSPAELMEARVMMEPTMIELVIRNATSADFLRMEDCCLRGEDAPTLAEFEFWDAALHQAIADATHNNFFRAVFQLMNKVRDQGDWGMLKKKSVSPERRLVYQKEHRALVKAFKERDADRARELLVGHLLRVRKNMLGY